MANNYFYTGRRNKAVEMLSVVNNVDPGNEVVKEMMHYAFCDQIGEPRPDLSHHFGQPWFGEDIEEKTIQVYCDQGMGDTINLLRYVEQLKSKGCTIVLNCYAFFNQFEKFMAQQPYIDKLTPFFERTDYYTNIMSLPALLNNIELDCYYPVHFRKVMEAEIPPQTKHGVFEPFDLGKKLKVGVAWQTNAENHLAAIKSIPVEKFEILKRRGLDFYCLQPNIETPEWVNVAVINDLNDTARYIESMDFVVSVDTAVLHLAGYMQKPTIGLLPFECDPRWGSEVSTAWYPSVHLVRQHGEGDWDQALMDANLMLDSLLQIK